MLLTLLTGCGSWTYRHVRIGQPPREYEQILPAEKSRHTAVGICYLDVDQSHRSDALVVLLTDDRRVAGKLWARHRHRKAGSNYRLVGKIDPVLFGTQAAGMTNTLRAIAVELTEQHDGQFAAQAHAWVAGGIVRLLEQAPGPPDLGVSSRRLDELFDRVPGGGVSRMEFDRYGNIVIEYESAGSTDGSPS